MIDIRLIHSESMDNTWALGQGYLLLAWTMYL